MMSARSSIIIIIVIPPPPHDPTSAVPVCPCRCAYDLHMQVPDVAFDIVLFVMKKIYVISRFIVIVTIIVIIINNNDIPIT